MLGQTSQNVDTVGVKQCGLILLPTRHHLLELLLRIAIQKSILKLGFVILNPKHVLD
jgi:hypothetical protein